MADLFSVKFHIQFSMDNQFVLWIHTLMIRLAELELENRLSSNMGNMSNGRSSETSNFGVD
jgi:hypothetical protein